MAFKWVKIGNLKGPAGPPGDAAATARMDRLDQRDAVLGSDPRIGQIVDSPYLIPFADDQGALAGGFKPNAALELLVPPVFPEKSFGAEVLDPARGIGALDPTGGFLETVTDRDGYIAFGVDRHGIVHDNGTSLRNRVTWAGDSMVLGGTVTTDGIPQGGWDFADSAPGKMQALDPSVTVTREGWSGRTIDDIRWYIGAKPIWLQFPGGVIPAAVGKYPVTISENVATSLSTVGTFFGWVNGTTGNLELQADGSWLFNKSNVTNAIPAPGKVAFTRTNNRAQDYSLETMVIWGGRNDVSSGIKGAEGDVVEHVVASIVKLVEWLKPRNKQFLILSVTNRVQEPKGSAQYEQVVAINDRLRMLYPGHYVDVRKWLVHEAIHELGYTPTAADLANMEKDAPPPQIMDWGTHYLKPVAPLLAKKVRNHLLERAYI